MPQGAPGQRTARRVQATRSLLVLAAGAANVFGFLALGGLFTSVVTANSATAGLRLGSADFGALRLVLLALLGYVAGVAAGSLAAAGRGRVPGRGLLGGLLIETAALWLVVFGWLYWEGSPDAAQRAALLVLTAAAMGCQNGAIRISARGEVTTAYLTGMVTSTVAVLVTQGRVVWRNVGTAVLFTAGAAAAGAAFRWVHLGTPVIPALLVTVALATHEPSAQQR